VRLVREQGRTVADVAKSLGIHVNTLHTAVKGLPKEGAGPRLMVIVRVAPRAEFGPFVRGGCAVGRHWSRGREN
jgi:transposase-like protein